MSINVENPFKDYFHIESAKVDVGLLKFESGSLDATAKAFFDYQYAIDLHHRRNIEVVDLTVSRSVILPKSARNRTKVLFAGRTPVFASFDKHYNLITYMVLGSVVRVEYLGERGKEKKVKYFRCLRLAI